MLKIIITMRSHSHHSLCNLFRMGNYEVNTKPISKRNPELVQIYISNVTFLQCDNAHPLYIRISYSFFEVEINPRKIKYISNQIIAKEILAQQLSLIS